MPKGIVKCGNCVAILSDSTGRAAFVDAKLIHKKTWAPPGVSTNAAGTILTFETGAAFAGESVGSEESIIELKFPPTWELKNILIYFQRGSVDLPNTSLTKPVNSRASENITTSTQTKPDFNPQEPCVRGVVDPANGLFTLPIEALLQGSETIPDMSGQTTWDYTWRYRQDVMYYSGLTMARDAEAVGEDRKCTLSGNINPFNPQRWWGGSSPVSLLFHFWPVTFNSISRLPEDTQWPTAVDVNQFIWPTYGPPYQDPRPDSDGTRTSWSSALGASTTRSALLNLMVSCEPKTAINPAPVQRDHYISLRRIKAAPRLRTAKEVGYGWGGSNNGGRWLCDDDRISGHPAEANIQLPMSAIVSFPVQPPPWQPPPP